MLAYAKTKMQISCAVTAQLISAFVFNTQVVQFLFSLNEKFQVSSNLLCLYSSICVQSVRKPHCWLSHDGAQIVLGKHLMITDSFALKDITIFILN